MQDVPTNDQPPSDVNDDSSSSPKEESQQVPVEIGGRQGPEPTRYGDWEKGGRCIDF